MKANTEASAICGKRPSRNSPNVSSVRMACEEVSVSTNQNPMATEAQRAIAFLTSVLVTQVSREPWRGQTPKKDIVYIFLSNRVYPDADNTKLLKMDVRTNIQQVIYDSIVE